MLYFADFTTPFTNTYSLYSDLLDPYIEIIKNLWTKVISHFNNLSDTPDTTDTTNIQNEIKVGIKQGVKEALNEILNEINLQNDVQPDVQSEVNIQPNSYFLKDLAFYISLLFFGYFFFVLPGPSINPEVLTDYNWFNQALIEFKITVKDLIVNIFSKPGNPGAPIAPGNIGVVDSPVTPTSLNTYFIRI